MKLTLLLTTVVAAFAASGPTKDDQLTLEHLRGQFYKLNTQAMAAQKQADAAQTQAQAVSTDYSKKYAEVAKTCPSGKLNDEDFTCIPEALKPVPAPPPTTVSPAKTASKGAR